MPKKKTVKIEYYLLLLNERDIYGWISLTHVEGPITNTLIYTLHLLLSKSFVITTPVL